MCVCACGGAFEYYPALWGHAFVLNVEGGPGKGRNRMAVIPISGEVQKAKRGERGKQFVSLSFSAPESSEDPRDPSYSNIASLISVYLDILCVGFVSI